jgi:hypothetical protein
MNFVVCASCARHVRASETTCPFCKEKVVAAVVPPTPMDLRRWHVIVMAVGAVACGKTTAQPDAAPSATIPVAAPPYGVTAEPLPEAPDAAPTISPPRPVYGLPRNDRLPDGGIKKKIGPP